MNERNSHNLVAVRIAYVELNQISFPKNIFSCCFFSSFRFSVSAVGTMYPSSCRTAVLTADVLREENDAVRRLADWDAFRKFKGRSGFYILVWYIAVMLSPLVF